MLARPGEICMNELLRRGLGGAPGPQAGAGLVEGGLVAGGWIPPGWGLAGGGGGDTFSQTRGAGRPGSV